MLPMLLSYEVVDAVAGQRDVRRVRVHFTVLVEGPLDVSTIKTAQSVSTIDFDDCYKSVVNEMVVNAGEVPVYEVVVEFQHSEFGVLINKEAYVEGEVVCHARLAGRHFVGVVGDDVQLPKAFVVDQQRRPDLRAVRDIAVTIDIRHRLAVRRVAEELHCVGDDRLVGIGVAIASSSGYRLTKLLEARLSFVLDDLEHAIHHEAVREVPL